MITRAPVQARATTTVERAVAAAVEIIAAEGPDGLTFRGVTERSGISTGSLTHHFGSLRSLAAAAHAWRHERSIDDRIGVAGRMLAEGVRLDRLLDDLLERYREDAGAARESRRARLESIAYARHHAELREHLGGVLAATRDRLAPLLDRAADLGAIPGPVDAGAVAVFLQTYTTGTFADVLLDDPLPEQDWAEVLRAAVHGGFTPSAARSTAPPTAPAPPTGRGLAWTDAREERVVRDAAARLLAGGPDAVVVRDLLEGAGVSPGWFWRHFTGRDELLDLVRLDALERDGDAEADALASAVVGAVTPGALGPAVVGVLFGSGSGDDAGRSDRSWSRVDLVLAAIDRGQLRREVAPVLAGQLDVVVGAVDDARRRGVVRRELSPDAVARLLWGLPVSALLGEVAGLPRAAQTAFAVRTVGGLAAGA